MKPWDKARSEQLLADMSERDIESLRQRSLLDPCPLSLEEIGVLFIITRNRIREKEAQAQRS